MRLAQRTCTERRSARYRRTDYSSGFDDVDFADVRTVMSEMGYAMMGLAWRAVKTVRKKLLKWLSLLAAGRYRPVWRTRRAG